MSAKFCIFKSGLDGDYYFHLQAANGEIVLSGEGYTTKQSCRDGIISVKLNAGSEQRFERRNSYMNYRFNLHGANGKIIARSEGYYSAQNRDEGIMTVKRLAPTAVVVDATMTV